MKKTPYDKYGAMQLNRRGFVFILIILLFLSFPLLLFVLRQNQDTRQRASVDTSTLAASFGDQVITTVELEAYVKEVIPQSAESILADPEERKYFLDLLVEKRLIEQEAKKQNIQVTSQQIETKRQSVAADKTLAEAKRLSLAQDQEALSEEILKERVSDKVEAWKQVDMVSVYISPEVPNFEANRRQAQTILEEMRSLVSSSTTLPQAYERLKSKYARQLAQMRLQEGIKIEKGNKMDPELKNPLFQVKKGQVSPVIISTGGAMMIVVVLNENTTSFPSYEAWLTQQKKGVTYY